MTSGDHTQILLHYGDRGTCAGVGGTKYGAKMLVFLRIELLGERREKGRKRIVRETGRGEKERGGEREMGREGSKERRERGEGGGVECR